MCGIAAIYGYHYAALDVDREELRRIRDRMADRGPDGQGEWFSQDGRVALGHRRLSVIDISESGAQPMCSADGRLAVTFNGEIYNYRALRAGLERKGCAFRSHSDTEVLLHLYAEKGPDMLNDLRGMFAFALWDDARKGLFLARDPYGIKPLYYADDGWTMRVASQVKALLAGGKISRQQEPAGLVGFFLLGSVPEPYTLYQEVRAVPAGSWIWVDELGPSEPRTWFSLPAVFRQAAQGPLQLPPDAVQEIVREALLDSVRHHLVADVPVGAFLSSGVDSGAIVGLANEVCYGSSSGPPVHAPSPLQTITLAFSEFRARPEDEAPLAAQVARHYGTEHTTRLVTEQEFHADLPRILEAMDQPSVDGINTWFVSKAARELGLKVALSGMGGDELFGGYSSFRDLPRWVRWLTIPSRIPGAAEAFRFACEAITHVRGSASGAARRLCSLSPKAAGLLKYGSSYPGAYLLRRGLFLPWELTSFLDRETVREGLRRLQPLALIGKAVEPDPHTPFARVAALEAGLYMKNQLLRDADWAGMAHSVEIRVPLVDATLVKTLAPALVAQPQLDGKRLLAGSPSRPLLPAVTNRAKTGFSTPVECWINGKEQPQMWHAVPHLSARGCAWARRWAYRVNLRATG